ncbi:MAG: peptidoglycan-binding protein LysM [Bdellovibrionales bacterium]|nr:peptidoglycan-binding protein LysM [Bdellovibrionales bacterium]
MGLVSFFKNAGEKLFGTAKEPDAESIKKYIQSQGLSTEGLDISFDKGTDTVTVAGQVADQTTKEKILLCCGNVQGVAKVQDNLKVSSPSQESQYYTVQSGDTLSKIAARFYGDAKKYNLIFDANRPMLSHPDKIYPGQNLRIPPQGVNQEKVMEQHP